MGRKQIMSDPKREQPAELQRKVRLRSGSLAAANRPMAKNEQPARSWLPKALLGSGRSKRRHDFRIGAIPHTQNTVVSTGDDDFAIGRDRGRVHEIGSAFKGAYFLAIVTDRANLVVARGRQCLVGASDETDGGHFLGETFNGFLRSEERRVGKEC